MKKIKLLFASHDYKFMKEIIEFFKDNLIFDIKFDTWDSFKKHNEKKSRDYLNWADVIVAEWCLGNAVWYSKNKLPHQKLFVRLHRFETSTEYLKKLEIKNINKLIFVGPHYQRVVEEIINIPTEKKRVIYNTVDVNKFKKSKSNHSFFNIGMLGYHTKRKRPDKALDIFEQLRKVDNRYTLYFKGQHPSKVKWVWNKDHQRNYYEVLFDRIKTSPYKDSIIFDQWDTAVHKWFKKIGVILSTSDDESFHLAVAEGMASGSIPMITGWDGADKIYPKEFIKKDVQEIVKTIQYLQKNPYVYKAKQKKVIEYCKNHFDINKTGEQWLEIILKS
ncbi:glycosyltransferase family 4 protein [Alkalihalobacterium elongatum]|uniref:glycosyltransferase family 4 protein n=1 Tax=Alkalihalobacterium elongatum TaxID=2675466 RepID=UPI001C1FDB8F|nr:glycosyltransferase family 4 protein [Alkalihalobacterium elongatum]